MTTFPAVPTWNNTYITAPADTDDEAQGALQIRTLKAGITERLVVDHSWAGDASDGKHARITLRNQGQTTAYTLDAGDGAAWGAATGGRTELFFQDSSGTVTQITLAGEINPGALPVTVVIPSGTLMLFAQASPPTGWTLGNIFNDRLIRVVNTVGGGSGGSWAISGGTVGGHTLSAGEIPQHTHQIPMAVGGGVFNQVPLDAGTSGVVGGDFANPTDGGTGGGASHDHPLSFDGSWRPNYADVIIGVKT